MRGEQRGEATVVAHAVVPGERRRLVPEAGPEQARSAARGGERGGGGETGDVGRFRAVRGHENPRDRVGALRRGHRPQVERLAGLEDDRDGALAAAVVGAQRGVDGHGGEVPDDGAVERRADHPAGVPVVHELEVRGIPDALAPAERGAEPFEIVPAPLELVAVAPDRKDRERAAPAVPPERALDERQDVPLVLDLRPAQEVRHRPARGAGRARRARIRDARLAHGVDRSVAVLPEGGGEPADGPAEQVLERGAAVADLGEAAVGVEAVEVEVPPAVGGDLVPRVERGDLVARDDAVAPEAAGDEVERRLEPVAVERFDEAPVVDRSVVEGERGGAARAAGEGEVELAVVGFHARAFYPAAGGGASELSGAAESTPARSSATLAATAAGRSAAGTLSKPRHSGSG